MLNKAFGFLDAVSYYEERIGACLPTSIMQREVSRLALDNGNSIQFLKLGLPSKTNLKKLSRHGARPS
jgi:hypothetical protein